MSDYTSQIVKELYDARRILMEAITPLTRESIRMKQNIETYETKHWHDPNRKHLDKILDMLGDTISEIGDRILKIEHQILEHWGLPNMKVVPVEHITIFEDQTE